MSSSEKDAVLLKEKEEGRTSSVIGALSVDGSRVVGSEEELDEVGKKSKRSRRILSHEENRKKKFRVKEASTNLRELSVADSRRIELDLHCLSVSSLSSCEAREGEDEGRERGQLS